MKNKRKGVVLIMVLGVLAILSVLGVMLTRLTSLERTTARAYRDLVQARMLAESGVFYGVVHTRLLLSEKGFSQEYQYFGEDLNCNGELEGTVEDSNRNNKLEVYNCPLRRAIHPSFMADLNGDGNLDENDLIEIRGRKIGVSSEMPQTDNKKNFFSIRVEDLSSRIYVNMEDHPHLTTILENLAEEVGLKRNVGTRIAQNRGEGYSALSEIKSKAKLTDEEYTEISPFLTVYAWLDKKVVKSVPLSERFGHPQIGQPVYSWAELRPRYIDYPRMADPKDPYLKGQIAGRAPVNINAAPKEVLVALLTGLKGFYLNEGAMIIPMVSGYGMMDVRYSYTGGSGSLGRLVETPAITRETARQIAESIIANRSVKEAEKQYPWEGPFSSWQQFDQFCTEVLWLGKGRAPYKKIISAQTADVLRANFNPNSNINDFNPDFHRMYWTDKTDLTYFTTEFAFFPSGYFSIDCIGRVLDQNNYLLAEAELNTIVKLFEIYRETSQSDFLYDYWHENKPLEESFTVNNGLYPTTNNLGLQTYPEPLIKEYVRDANYDGYLSLATIEHKPTKKPRFIAHYSGRKLEADTGQKLIPDIAGPVADRLTYTTTDVPTNWRPGKLFPDGVYSEIDAVPMYDYRPSNFDWLTVSMWLKPHFFPEAAAKVRVYLTYQIMTRGGPYNKMPYGIYSISNTYGLSGWGDQSWRRYIPTHLETNSLDGYDYVEPWDSGSLMAGGVSSRNKWQGGVGTPCLNHIGHDHTGLIPNWETYYRAGKWLHLSWIRQPGRVRDKLEKGEVFVFGVQDVLYINGQRCGGMFATGAADARPVNYAIPGNILRLGEKKNAPFLNTAPDATLDEILIWQNHNPEMIESMILDIWKEGRYYKENDATFTSRAIDLGHEMGRPQDSYVTLFIAAWTQYRPETLPPGATCEISILDSNRDTLTEPGNLKDPNGSLIKTYDGNLVKTNKPIHYRVHFKPQTTVDNVVVDSLIFDDITLIYYANPRFLSWNVVTQ